MNSGIFALGQYLHKIEHQRQLTDLKMYLDFFVLHFKLLKSGVVQGLFWVLFHVFVFHVFYFEVSHGCPLCLASLSLMSSYRSVVMFIVSCSHWFVHVM